MNCLVTGAASGLGLATATRLAKAGANVVLADLASNRSQLESITADLGPSTLAACMDVTKPAEVEAALDECEARFGTVDAAMSDLGTVMDPDMAIKILNEAHDILSKAQSRAEYDRFMATATFDEATGRRVRAVRLDNEVRARAAAQTCGRNL